MYLMYFFIYYLELYVICRHFLCRFLVTLRDYHPFAMIRMFVSYSGSKRVFWTVRQELVAVKVQKGFSLPFIS